MDVEGLSVVVVNNAPRVRNGDLGGALELTAVRVVAEEAAISGAHGTVGGLDRGHEVDALPHEDAAAGVGGKGGDRMVRIVVIKARQDNLGLSLIHI